MHLIRVLPIAALTLLASTTGSLAQVRLRGFSNPVECSGPNFLCPAAGTGICCSLPAGFGLSAQFESLPAGAQGSGYVDGTCQNLLFSVFGPGTRCWNGGGRSVSSLNFSHSAAGRDISARQNCVLPTGFTYHNGEGVERTIKVPSGDPNAAEVIVQLYLNRDWEALAVYEDA